MELDEDFERLEHNVDTVISTAAAIWKDAAGTICDDSNITGNEGQGASGDGGAAQLGLDTTSRSAAPDAHALQGAKDCEDSRRKDDMTDPVQRWGIAGGPGPSDQYTPDHPLSTARYFPVEESERVFQRLMQGERGGYMIQSLGNSLSFDKLF
jgi:hypothetical protein